MPQDLENKDQYLVGAFVQACRVMASFRSPREALSLTEIVSRTGLQKGTAFRLLYTLHHEYFLEKTADNRYRLSISLPRKTKIRIGYSANERDSFTRAVTDALMEAAAQARVEMICVNNNASSELALENAKFLVEKRIDLAIIFFGDYTIGDSLAHTFRKANIPLIAIDVPYPGATYYGANNYHAGLLAGRHMGRWGKLHWRNRNPTFLLIGYRRAGSLVHSRLRGMQAGIKECWKETGEYRFATVDSVGDYGSSYKSVQEYLNSSPAEYTIIGAINDPAALGALDAFKYSGRIESCAVMGQNAERQIRIELRRPGTRLIGSVAYFPEKYGRAILKLARKILTGAQVSPAVVTKHVLVTRENLDRLYPNDALLDSRD